MPPTATVGSMLVTLLIGLCGFARAAGPEPASGWNHYRNPRHGFQIRYPPGMRLRTKFEGRSFLTSQWRQDPDPGATPGEAIVELVVRDHDWHGDYQVCELRIGASRDPRSIRRALHDRHSQTAGSVRLGGVLFRRFTFHGEGMSQSTKGTSYRAIRSGEVLVIEEIVTESHANLTGPAEQRDRVSAADRCGRTMQRILGTLRFTSPRLRSVRKAGS